MGTRSLALWAVLISSLAVVPAAYWVRSLLRPAVHSLPVAPKIYGSVPDFMLTDQAGRPFESRALRGRVWIADFIFTSCAGACPEMSRKMSSLQKRLPREVQLVSVSVDPARDRPPVLAEYAARYRADPGRWHFLTGQPETLQALVQQGFRLSYAEGGDPQEPITHSQRFVLVDRVGAIRGYYDSTDPAKLAKLLEDARSLVRPPSG